MPFPCRGRERSRLERNGRGIAGDRRGKGMVCVNQTRLHCLNQMGKIQSKPLAERHGRETVWQGNVMTGKRHGRETAWRGNGMAGKRHGRGTS
jgi:hypothetical protein